MAPLPPSYDFLKTSPTKTDAPTHPSLKMKLSPSEKQTPLFKYEIPFHEMIPRKITINNNLESS